MHATPSCFAFASSRVISSTSRIGSGPGATGGPPERPAAGGSPFAARTAADAAANFALKSVASDVCSWNRVAPPASSSGV
jgi:hypothetical protein